VIHNRLFDVYMKRKAIFSISITAVLLLSFITIHSVNTKIPSAELDKELNSYITHEPMVITSDADFGAGGYGLPGDGSAGTPYLIENLNITNKVGSYGVYIENVTKYFEIRNCYIQAEYPIYIESITSNFVLIYNNTIQMLSGVTPTGIYISSSSHFEISYNEFYGGGTSGIYAEYCSSFLINHNYFTLFWNCMDIHNCLDWDVFNNVFDYNDGDQYVDSSYFTFYNNTWIDNNNGLYLGVCSDFNITGNFFIENDYFAVTVYACLSINFIYHNWFLNNNLASSIESQASDNTGVIWHYGSIGNFWLDYSGEGKYWIFEDVYDPVPIWDSDSDGLNEYDEIYVYGTDEYDYDSDNDLLPDGYEVEQGLDPLLDDAKLDPDTDGLINLDEYKFGTQCQDWDTDGDAMSDGYEVFHSLNPLFDDASLDFDGDGLTNLQEYNLGTKANNYDSDMDGMSDYWENENGLNPLVNDAWMDLDNDGLNNFLEYIYNCNPNDEDSDNDSYKDGEEILQGTNPNDPEDFPSTTYQPTTTESTYYWIGGLFALIVVTSLPIIIQRIRINKLRELVKEYFPRMKF